MTNHPRYKEAVAKVEACFKQFGKDSRYLVAQTIKEKLDKYLEATTDDDRCDNLVYAAGLMEGLRIEESLTTVDDEDENEFFEKAFAVNES